jgi:hypothetical protein
MEIIKGKIATAKKVVIYGPEGIGKSTFASKFPNPLFIDTEGSTNSMDVARLPKPSSWQMILEEIDYVRTHPDICKSLVIDTVDWAEHMCVEFVCSKHKKSGIEDFGYGNGYVYTKEEFGRFLNRLSDDIVECGINAILTAHAQIRKFEQPDELGAYDRYELKLGKKTSSQTSPLIKEWSDMLLFANYKTYSVAVDDKGQKHKAQGGERVMYTSHHPCWDAKNRDGLLPELPFDYAAIAHIIPHSSTVPVSHSQSQAPANKPESQTTGNKGPDQKRPEPEQKQSELVQKQVKLEQNEPKTEQKQVTAKPQSQVGAAMSKAPAGVPQKLWDLMLPSKVTAEEVRNAVAEKGYYPVDTPIENYDPEFVDGCLIAAWPQLLEVIEDNRKLPF